MLSGPATDILSDASLPFVLDDSMYQGFFINLDRNETRRQALTKHLEERGALARYRRIGAVDGRAVAHEYPSKLDPGALGLWLSHARMLQ
jgi:hypothetical protein